MKTEVERWIEAGKVLALDPSAKVLCPRCTSTYLTVRDVPLGPTKMERHLRCASCGAYNAIIGPKG